MKDLLKLYSIHSVSNTAGEKEICDWIAAKLDVLAVPYQRKGNTLYSITQENKVMLSAHLDQVETAGPAVHFFKSVSGFITAYNDKWQRTSLGADDKNGVWLILKLLEKGYKFDFIISECEEIGGDGIKSVEQFIKDSSAEFCLVLDRRGLGDIIKKGGATPYCEALAYNLKNFWKDSFKVTTGSLSDAHTICKYIESVNLSVAYFDPHTDKESTNYPRLLEIMQHIERVLKGEFVHYAASPKDYEETTITYTKWRNYDVY